MNAAKTVTATFTVTRATFVLTVNKTGQRQRQRELESVGNQLRRGLLRALHQRHQRDADGKRRRRVHIWRLERMQHGFRHDVFGDHECGEDGHRHVQSGDRKHTRPTSVSAGGEYTCVRLSDGTAQCTGRNQFGQHGNGT